MSVLKRGCLAIVIVVVVVLVGGYIYFSINPPLALPETGYLSATETDELRPGAFNAPRAYRLRVEPSSRIYERDTTIFPPARIVASVAGEGGVGSTTIEVLPASGSAVPLFDSEGPGTATWELDCASGSCVGDYILVVSPNSTSTELEATLEVFAEQEFPAHVPTPFMAGIDVDLDPIELPPSRPFEADAESHTVTVGPDAPVALFDIAVDSPVDAAIAGATLTVTAERLEPTIAVGPAAPPPVRVALVDGGNQIVADVGTRPGTPSRVAVPPLRGHYRIVAWWQDFADQRYDITWELKVSSVSDTDRPSIDVATRPAPGPSETITSEGEASVGGAGAPNGVALGIDWETGTATEPGRLPAIIGVLHSRVELVEYEGASPLLLSIGAAYASSYEPHIPVVLRVGDPVEIAIDVELDCQGNRCGPWSGFLTDPADADSPDGLAGAATVRWDSTLVVWPLRPEE